MKLLFAVVSNDDSKDLVKALVEQRISVTRIASSGGFLRSGNSTLMIGVDEERLQETLDIIKEKSSRRHSVVVPVTGLPYNVSASAMPLKITIGGATVFILDVEQFHKF